MLVVVKVKVLLLGNSRVLVKKVVLKKLTQPAIDGKQIGWLFYFFISTSPSLPSFLFSFLFFVLLAFFFVLM